jgi:hypothetical protein
MALAAGFRQEVKGGEEALSAWKGKKGRWGIERAAMMLGAFKAARRGSRGGSIWSGAAPRNEEVGDGPGPIARWRAAGNGPAVACMWAKPRLGRTF